jgi:hypothetical protein
MPTKSVVSHGSPFDSMVPDSVVAGLVARRNITEIPDGLVRHNVDPYGVAQPSFYPELKLLPGVVTTVTKAGILDYFR